VGENRAGASSVATLGAGEAARIFTGARLPDGADAIALEENARREGESVRFSRPSRPGEFVRPAGLDFQAGWTGLAAGTVLGPRALGLAAAMGHVWLPVRRLPRVAILSSGDELVRPGEPASAEQIVSSNAFTLGAHVRRWGGAPVDLGIAGDSRAAIRAAVGEVEQADLLVTIGGASIGEYDLIRPSLAEDGLALDFWRLAMRPGKPMMFGRLGTTPVLGLPGNPVSAAVCAILFVRPLLRALLGLDPGLERIQARTASELRANDEREDYLRARRVTGPADGLWLETAARQDSSMFATLARADALIVRAPTAPAVAAGGTVEAILLAPAERLD
jgi:molybdopterin molybdotransferase